MDTLSGHTHNKSIEWDYLPDEQLSSLVSKYPFYTKANVEIFKRIYTHASPDFDNLKDKTFLHLSNTAFVEYYLSNKNKLTDKSDKNIKINNLDTDENHDFAPNSPLDTISPDNYKTNESLIPVEPLYTVDYFLSQGIKITEDSISNDKLGSQLKSFTDWLKSMKKVHPQKSIHEADNTDKVIQTIAEHSNEAAPIETEAMAEVLIRQGKRLQALEIYQKLSLKNPRESAYFAAKIQSLKDL